MILGELAAHSSWPWELGRSTESQSRPQDHRRVRSSSRSFSDSSPLRRRIGCQIAREERHEETREARSSPTPKLRSSRGQETWTPTLRHRRAPSPNRPVHSAQPALELRPAPRPPHKQEGDQAAPHYNTPPPPPPPKRSTENNQVARGGRQETPRQGKGKGGKGSGRVEERRNRKRKTVESSARSIGQPGVKQKEPAKDKPQQTNLKTKLLKLVYLLLLRKDPLLLKNPQRRAEQKSSKREVETNPKLPRKGFHLGLMPLRRPAAKPRPIPKAKEKAKAKPKPRPRSQVKLAPHTEEWIAVENLLRRHFHSLQTYTWKYGTGERPERQQPSWKS